MVWGVLLSHLPLLDDPEPSGDPLRHVFELLHLEQILSPAHWLWNVASHRKHCRTFGTSARGSSVGTSVAGVVDIIIPLIENKYKLVKPGVRSQLINNKLPSPKNMWTNSSNCPLVISESH